MEDAEAIAERQDKANHMKFTVVEQTFSDIEAKQEEIYQQFKEVWVNNPDISKKQAYHEIGREYTGGKYLDKYINQRLEEDGLPVNHYEQHKGRPKKEVNFNVVESSTSEEYESFYQEFKEIWIANPIISKVEAFKKLGRAYHSSKSRTKYINQRLKEDGLPVTHKQIGVKNPVDINEYEKKYSEFRELWDNTDLHLSEIYEKFGITPTAPSSTKLGAYIAKRKKEDGLNGNARAWRIRNKNKPKKNENKSKPKKRGGGRPKKSESEPKPEKKPPAPPVKNHEIDEQLRNSEELLNKFYNERNVKLNTKKGYHASLTRFFKYTGDKYGNLQDCLDFYMKEEDEKIPMRNRSIKKEMLGFREWLLEDKGIKSDKSVRSYFSKLGTVFRHFGLEIPQLPQVKMEKGYVSSYNDLPTHDMIKTACEQSPIDLKALILFMSSSGSAKAETLSITIGMFLEGCNDYLQEPASPDNIHETLLALDNRHDIVPLIYLRRIKTDKWYFTCCSPEASYIIVEALKIRDDFKWDDKLFDYTSSMVLTKFQELNDNNKWGNVGAYRRFRSHALRKFMASNIGLPRDQVDSFQGRAKDMIQEAYFKQDPQSLKKIYLEAMHRVMIYENWGHGTTPAEIERRRKRLMNDFNDDEKILDLSTIPETPEDIKSSIGLETDHENLVSTVKKSRTPNKSNSLPLSQPVQVAPGYAPGYSVAKELLMYSELMEKGLLSVGEFNRVKQKLLIGVLR